jgi:hypothetical protein
MARTDRTRACCRVGARARARPPAQGCHGGGVGPASLPRRQALEGGRRFVGERRVEARKRGEQSVRRARVLGVAAEEAQVMLRDGEQQRVGRAGQR